MVASEGFMEFLREQLEPFGRITARRMFGATGVFRDGLMFGIVTDDTLYVRIDDESRAFFHEASSQPLTYQRLGRVVDLPFWRVPDRLLDEPEELLTWARTALATARRVAAKSGRSNTGRKQRRRPG